MCEYQPGEAGVESGGCLGPGIPSMNRTSSPVVALTGWQGGGELNIWPCFAWTSEKRDGGGNFHRNFEKISPSTFYYYIYYYTHTGVLRKHLISSSIMNTNIIIITSGRQVYNIILVSRIDNRQIKYTKGSEIYLQRLLVSSRHRPRARGFGKRLHNQFHIYSLFPKARGLQTTTSGPRLKLWAGRAASLIGYQLLSSGNVHTQGGPALPSARERLYYYEYYLLLLQLFCYSSTVGVVLGINFII